MAFIGYAFQWAKRPDEISIRMSEQYYAINTTTVADCLLDLKVTHTRGLVHKTPVV